MCLRDHLSYGITVLPATQQRWFSRLYRAFTTHTHTHTHTRTHTNRFMAGHQSSLICFIQLLWSMASSLFNLHVWRSFSTISLQVFFGLPLGLAPSTSYSIHLFTNHCLLFAAHAHTIATCFAVVPRLYHLFLVSLSTLYLELSSLPAEVPPHFPFVLTRSHLRATYYFACNCCTIPAFTSTHFTIPQKMGGWPRHCSKGAQLMPKAVYYNGCRDKHKATVGFNPRTSHIAVECHYTTVT